MKLPLINKFKYPQNINDTPRTLGLLLIIINILSLKLNQGFQVQIYHFVS
jgi:hypothetical protein